MGLARDRFVAAAVTFLDICPYFSYNPRISLIEGAFLGGKPEKRSEGGARARICSPLPGGSGAPLGRHKDRSARSSLDWTSPRRAKHPPQPRPRKRGSGAEPMLVATGLASAAAKRRKAGAPRLARCRDSRRVAHTAYTCRRCADNGWHAPFGAPPPVNCRGRA